MGVRAAVDAGRAELHRRLAEGCRRHRAGAAAVDVTARVDRRVQPVGGLALDGDAYAERFADTPVLIFLVSENTPREGDVYAFESDRAYEVENVEPRHGVTVSAVCFALPAARAQTYGLPE